MLVLIQERTLLTMLGVHAAKNAREAYVGTVIWFTLVVMLLVRPGKPDLLFCISHILDLRAGGWSLFIIHY